MPLLRFLLPALLLQWFSSVAFAEVSMPQDAQLGPRPFYLVDQLGDSALKRELAQCVARQRHYVPTDFSIGHRGAPLQFPEHTVESYVAAARMGAGILECDVTFTKDAELVCRHAQCDLHSTTNIVATDLAPKCTVPPELDAAGRLGNGPQIKCCTSDITLDEYRSLEGKMDGANTSATTIAGYLGGTADFRTDLYTTGATLVTHADSIELFRKLGRKFTPELKGADTGTPPPQNTLEQVFGALAQSGETAQQAYARKLIEEYGRAGIAAKDVWVQSFDLDDVLYWIDEFPDFGRQAVFLDGRSPVALVNDPPSPREFDELHRRGVNIIAPPISALLTLADGHRIVPSSYAERARKAGLEIISWTTERSGRVNEDIVPAGGAFYYDTTVDALASDGAILRTIDVLAQQVGIIGLFSDWPATTTFYANCKDIPRLRGGSEKGAEDRPDESRR